MPNERTEWPEIFQNVWQNLFKFLNLRQEQEALRQQREALGFRREEAERGTLFDLLGLYGESAYKMPGFKQLAPKYGITEVGIETQEEKRLKLSHRQQIIRSLMEGNYIDSRTGKPISMPDRLNSAVQYDRTGEFPDYIAVPESTVGEIVERKLPEKPLTEADKLRIKAEWTRIYKDAKVLDSATGKTRDFTSAELGDVVDGVMKGISPRKQGGVYASLVFPVKKTMADIIAELEEVEVLEEAGPEVDFIKKLKLTGESSSILEKYIIDRRKQFKKMGLDVDKMLEILKKPETK